MKKERAFLGLNPETEKLFVTHREYSRNCPLDLEVDLLMGPLASLQLWSLGDFALAPRLLFLEIREPRVVKTDDG